MSGLTLSIDQLGQSSSTNDMVNYLKSGHTLSLDKHQNSPTDMHKSRHRDLLLSRGPSYPANLIDLSMELSNENVARRKIHEKIMKSDSSVFRRKAGPQSLTEQLNERRNVNTLLKGMHGLKDLDDLDRKKAARITFSINAAKDKKEKEEHADLMYKNLLPLDDFVRPEDTDSPRHTGYEMGHIRSLMKTSTYGPSSSALASLERELGLLPEHTPSIDRYRKDSDIRTDAGSTLGSRGSSRINSRQARSIAGSRASSRAGSRNSNIKGSITTGMDSMELSQNTHYNQRVLTSETNGSTTTGDNALITTGSNNSVDGSKKQQRFADLENNTVGAESSTSALSYDLTTMQGDMQGLFHHTSYMLTGDLNFGRTEPAPAAGTLGYYGPAYTEGERALVDPILKRRQWYKSLKEREKNNKTKKTDTMKRTQHKDKQAKLAEGEKEAMREFERHLELARYNAARRGVCSLRTEHEKETSTTSHTSKGPTIKGSSPKKHVS